MFFNLKTDTTSHFCSVTTFFPAPLALMNNLNLTDPAKHLKNFAEYYQIYICNNLI